MEKRIMACKLLFRQNRWTVLLTTLLAIGIGGCAHNIPDAEKTSVTPTTAGTSSQPGTETPGAHWSYPAVSGPKNHWETDGYPECGPEVAMQSPTVLDPTTANTGTGWSLPAGLSSATYTVPLKRLDSHNNYDFKVDPSGT